MPLVTNAIGLILLVLIVRSVMKSAFVVWMMVDRRPIPRDTALLSNVNLIVLLKVFQEETAIVDAVNFIGRLISSHENLCAIIVGTTRERDSTGGNPTIRIATACASAYGARIKILEAPSFSTRNAAGQLNFAVSTIKENPTNTWILTVDVDTRFTDQGVAELIHYVNCGEDIIQQSGLFLSNFSDLDFLQKGYALFQSRWTVCHEVLRIRVNRRLGFVLANVVGHGLCINLRTLRVLGGFPDDTFAEDIHLGFNIASSGLKIRSCKCFDLSDAPRTFREGIRQEFSWSFSAMFYPTYWQSFLRTLRNADRPVKDFIRASCMCLQGVVLYLNWLVGSWLLALFIFLAFNGVTLAGVFLVVYLAEFILCAVLFVKIGALTFVQALVGCISSPLAALRHSLPANWGLIKTILGARPARIKSIH